MDPARDLLEAKRRRLVRELRSSLKAARDKRSRLKWELGEIYDTLSSAYFSLGQREVKTQIRSIGAKWKLIVLPLSFIGVRYPHIKTLAKPEAEADADLDLTLQEAQEEMYDIFEELLEMVEQEARVERMAHQQTETRRDETSTSSTKRKTITQVKHPRKIFVHNKDNNHDR